MSELLKCGHSANATQVLKDGSEIPVCAICGCTEIEEVKPDLTGRKARCSYFGQRARNGTCHGEVDSKYSLAFFKHNPKAQFDEYYCGCWGWD